MEDAGTAEIVGVAVAEEAEVAAPELVIQASPDSLVPSIQTFPTETSLNFALCTSDGGSQLISVQNRRHVLGKMSSLQSNPRIEGPTSPVNPLQKSTLIHYTLACTIKK